MVHPLFFQTNADVPQSTNTVILLFNIFIFDFLNCESTTLIIDFTDDKIIIADYDDETIIAFAHIEEHLIFF